MSTARAWSAVSYNPRVGSRESGNLSRRPASELTWTQAILIGLAMTAFLLIFLGWIPSHFNYFWWDRIHPATLIKNITGRELKDAYTLIRLRDAISMGYQTTVFAAIVVAVYIYMERRRRRKGQQGAEEPKGYLSGK